MRITITLVAPVRTENIGAAAWATRAIRLNDLRIVGSQTHLEPATRWVTHGLGDVIGSVRVFPTSTESLHDVDLTVATTAHSRVKYHYYATSVGLVPLLEEKPSWMNHAALMLGREDSGLTNGELALVNILTDMPMAVDYPLFNLGQAVMVYCYQLAALV